MFGCFEYKPSMLSDTNHTILYLAKGTNVSFYMYFTKREYTQEKERRQTRLVQKPLLA